MNQKKLTDLEVYYIISTLIADSKRK